MVGCGCDQGDVEFLAVLAEGAAGQVRAIVCYDDGGDAEMQDPSLSDGSTDGRPRDVGHGNGLDPAAQIIDEVQDMFAAV